MSELIGREIEVGIATEAVRGAAETSVTKWIKKTTATIVEKAEQVENDTTQGVFEQGTERKVVQKYIEGPLEGIVQADELGYLLGSVYGKVTTTLVSGSVYDHTFELKQNSQHPTLTLFGKDGGAQQIKYAGCVVDTLELSATTDDYVRFTAGIIGMVAEDDTETPSYGTTYDFNGCDIAIKLADTEAGLVGATAIKAKEFKVSKNQTHIKDYTFGACSPDNLYNANLALEGEFMLNFADETFKDLYLNNDAKYMQVIIESPEDIGGGNHPTITLLYNKIMLTDWSRDGGAEELVTQPISFKAYYNDTDGEASKITLRNLTTSYPNIPTS